MSAQIVARHPRMCHHCGFHGTVPEEVCADCGLQVHTSCRLMNVKDGAKQCDMCYHEVDAATVCALCLQPDKPWTDKDSTDRLHKTLVHFGRTWTWIPDADRHVLADDHNILEAGGHGADVVARLEADPHATFRPADLPKSGNEKMAAVLTDGRVYTSDPLVVHSFCQDAMQLGDVPDALDDKTKIVTYDPKANDPGNPFKQPKATWETHACKVCRKQEGYAVFCFAHVSLPSGCRKCHSTVAYHPSCAAWHGLQRYTYNEGQRGVACNNNHSFRAQDGYAKHKKALSCASGINKCFPPDAWDLDPGDVPRKGDCVECKVRRAPEKDEEEKQRAPRKKRRAPEEEKSDAAEKKPRAPRKKRRAPEKEEEKRDESIVVDASSVRVDVDVEEVVERRADALRTEWTAKMHEAIACAMDDDVEEIVAQRMDVLRAELTKKMHEAITHAMDALRAEVATRHTNEEAPLVD
jgi:hypothetical protein